MNYNEQRKRDLEDHLEQDYKLRKDLEDKLRYTDDPIEKGKINQDLHEIIARIQTFEDELLHLRSESLDNQDIIEIDDRSNGYPPTNLINIRKKYYEDYVQRKRAKKD